MHENVVIANVGATGRRSESPIPCHHFSLGRYRCFPTGICLCDNWVLFSYDHRHVDSIYSYVSPVREITRGPASRQHRSRGDQHRMQSSSTRSVRTCRRKCPRRPEAARATGGVGWRPSFSCVFERTFSTLRLGRVSDFTDRTCSNS